MNPKGLPSAFSAPNPASRRKPIDSIVENVDQPPNHRSRMSEGNSNFSAQGGGNSHDRNSSEKSTPSMNGGRHRSNSPNVAASSPSKDREDRSEDGDERVGTISPNSDMTDRSTPEESCPPKRKQIFFDLIRILN